MSVTKFNGGNADNYQSEIFNFIDNNGEKVSLYIQGQQKNEAPRFFISHAESGEPVWFNGQESESFDSPESAYSELMWQTREWKSI